ncbi:hypothetical protein B5K08_09280 [Rhizobium leguminosarum bv. trifolii]|uniref:Uncharacterized protein n=1 Tax=Rhizobium leguminosarum bv. trifolii TaxID=386 RepID=A0A3E1BQN1_RHILT|nr:hypothetical protein [Rhizobium leguminosarum]RFB96549.1 hypothetical protein B5K08_09280 [Rhizobium leguminosarum bv. trifolii]RFB96672.1 hypothetical protein B5K10_09265 [Rhizobium leguminosarum bv. trifolii]
MLGSLDALSAFLKYGPLGLAGLTLVLVVFILTRRLDERRERLIKLVLATGTICFVISSAAAFLDARLAGEKDLEIKSYQQREAHQIQALSGVEKVADHAASELAQLNRLTGDTLACPGGAHGQPIPHGSDMTRLGASIQGDLSSIKQSSASNSVPKT